MASMVYESDGGTLKKKVEIDPVKVQTDAGIKSSVKTVAPTTILKKLANTTPTTGGGVLTKLATPVTTKPVTTPVTTTQVAPIQTVTTDSGNSGGVVSDVGSNGVSSEMQNLIDLMNQQKEANIASQTATAQQMMDNEIARVQADYDKQVAEGKISMREAEAQFAEAKAGIEQKAYTDAEATALYGQEAGIINSQQQIGLQQGDTARTNANISKNVKDRDTRINDIRDRLTAITQNKDSAISLATKNFDTNVQGIKAGADAQAFESTYKLYADDYMSNKEFGQKKELTAIEKDNRLNEMAVSHGYDIENMDLEEQSKMRLMDKDLEQTFLTIDKNMANTLKTMAVGNAYSSAQALSSLDIWKQKTEIEKKNAIEITDAKIKNESIAIKNEYDTNLANALRSYTPGTKEYDAIKLASDWAYEESIKTAMKDAISGTAIDTALNPETVNNKKVVELPFGVGVSIFKSAYEKKLAQQEADAKAKADADKLILQYTPDSLKTNAQKIIESFNK